MRYRFAVLGLMLAATILPAQTQPQSNPPANPQKPAGVTPINPEPPSNPRLKQLLMLWEQKMKSVNALEADVVRYDTDAVTKTQKALKGKVKFLRPNRAYLRMDSTTDPTNYEEYVFTGTYLYEYLPRSKTLNIHELANQQGQVVQDNFLNFLFGMKAEEAERRFKITLAKEDANYIYFFIDPKFPADRQDFTKARLVLWATTYLPRQCEFEAPNNDTIKWDILRCEPMARLSPVDFQPREVSKDWNVKRVPKMPTNNAMNQPSMSQPPQPQQPQPTKVRPAGG